MQEHYLVIVLKKEKLKLFDGVWMCLGEKLRSGKRKFSQNLPRNCPKPPSSFFFFFFFFFLGGGKMRGLEAFIFEK